MSGRALSFGSVAEAYELHRPDYPVEVVDTVGVAGANSSLAVDEAGVPGLYASFWHAIWVPKGTPNDVVGKLNGAIRAALADPIIRQRFAEQGQEIWPPEWQTPEALYAHHKAEIEKWWPIIKEAGIRTQ